MSKHLNIIAFNIPYPPNYGGIIDVFYKIKALHEAGVKIILHCFEYERPHAPELETICEKVYYYKRRTGWVANLTCLPYNVYSRKNPKLMQRLLQNNYPILFEGLHSCYYLCDKRLKERIKICRAANIEHDYYNHLAQAESHLIRKLFFKIEAWRFKRYQPVLSHADRLLAVSTADADYLRRQFPNQPVHFMPCFHANESITSQPGSSDFILYHGKLSVTENTQAALFLIQHVFCHLKCRCVIAGMNPPRSLLKAASPYPHVHIVANPLEEQMNDLIKNAQIHILITFQATGLKLKLLNSLFAGRHIIVNSLMVNGSGLGELCHTANTAEEMVQACQQLIHTEFEEKQISQRRQILFPTFSNSYQGRLLCEIIQKA